MKATRDVKVLAILLVVFVFCDFLLSPLGFETRGSAILNNPSSLPWLGLLFGGLILNIISLILVFFRPRIASILSIIGSVGYIILAIGDQEHLVTSLAPPALITDVEVVTVVVLLAVLMFDVRIYRMSNRASVQ
jgi:hypothetical protein